MKLFGREIALKACGCNRTDCEGRPIAPSVNIFVKVTDACNACCRFCSNAGRAHPEGAFDLAKLVEIVREFVGAGVTVNRINVTGGEPSVVPPLVHELIAVFSTDEFLRLHLHLNTNGVTAESKALMREKRWNSISMSLHHYDPVVLAQIFGLKSYSGVLDFDGVDRDRLNVSCNLIRGYVDSSGEVEKMLDFTLSLGVPRIGFVALMKTNGYCRDHFVDLEEVGIDRIPRVHFTESRNRGADCKCSNYLYSKDGKILEIYLRNYANPLYCESSVVYDGQHLRQGFHEDNVIV